MARQIDKPIAMTIVDDHVEEAPKVAELVTRLEAEADQDIADIERVEAALAHQR